MRCCRIGRRTVNPGSDRVVCAELEWTCGPGTIAEANTDSLPESVPELPQALVC